ncbi:Rne/Rng family ribonuclease [Micromonospora sp. NBC_01796]|uniref:Rne/Rng family ribonuclease n=1 Tax=Micromonospora sp. NBC_01796 TaxID=2975987 RepID=UPI002DD8B1A3|nr:Rne/Rng family ribonuclease [Micromonospora sp. NBC_01796]WSA82900.1 Rne/Rng family ribonuclease [Micromonospora sp. NBC_01796]
MLDNEPEGGERTGSQPAGDPAETNDTTPVRRTRTTRRRTPSATAETTEGGAPVEAPGEARTGSDEAPQAEVFAPVAGDTEPAPKVTRRRRKATTADKRDEPPAVVGELGAGGEADPELTASGGDSTQLTGTAPVDSPTPAEEPEPTPPVKVTRTRRRKAVPAAVEAENIPAEPEVTAVTPPVAPPAAEQAAPATDAEQVPPGVAVPPTAETAPSGPDLAEPAEEEVPRTRRRRAALSAPTVLFMAPEPEIPPSRPTTPPPAVLIEPVVAPTDNEIMAEEIEAEPVETSRRRRRGRRTGEPTEQVVDLVEPATDAATDGESEPVDLDEDDEDEDDEAGGRRRRRRGRRGRGRGKGPTDELEDEETEEPAQADAEAEAEDDEDDDTEGGDGLTRRRRRRRRKGAGDSPEGGASADDGVHTVVKIREPRRTSDEVQGVSGSTRLEAKRQRRRDGREQRRTRPPILSESEFLARREAVDRVMVVRQRGDRTQIAVLEDGVLVEHYVTRATSGTMAGNVYLGKVQNVLPSMEAAFVDVGRGRNAVLYAGEVNWDMSGLEGRARSIEHALRSGDSVLVQVTKDPIGHKGARLTSHIALSGRHLVYVPNGNASGISRKLPDNERKRLRDVLKKLVPDGAGVIVRTAAEGASEDELARDVKRLQAQWEDIQARAAEGGAPAPLYEEPDLVIRVVRDLFNEDFQELLVQGDEAYSQVESYLAHVSPDLVARLHRHTGTGDVFVERRIDEQILKGLDRKVYLPSGGHLVIDRTEAMTVVDVNTGKYTGAGGNLEETVTRNNLEAAEEIVRQLRLRDLGGIVVIDFIDMVLESNRELVLRRLTECLGRDRTKHQVTEITSLGLVQMTRKRIGAGLLEAFSETCDCCKGRGVIIHTEPVPEKRPQASANGGGDRVKAVASATVPSTTAASAAPATEAAPAVSRRTRARKSAAPERVAVEIADSDEIDTMGYDLSRYEVDTTEAPDDTDAGSTGSARLAGADDPDALGESGELDEDGEPTEGGAGGRRRSRRGGTRRRTRP